MSSLVKMKDDNIAQLKEDYELLLKKTSKEQELLHATVEALFSIFL